MMNPNEGWRSIEELKRLEPDVDFDQFLKDVPLEVSEDGKFTRIRRDIYQQIKKAEEEETEESIRTGKFVKHVDVLTGEEVFSINYRDGIIKYPSNKRKKSKGFGK